ncbi:hypothetical protein Q0590_24950 [Rhodocytophaga aerolata]|uniref:Uncharacterized protein n=1 Tax=Rhodocytophaga aerolata TaxID=455078 RepID=A0ABT8RBS6_9BACT|nr:hypothetical protein [Rhodocytophaga aerolata]MDO1449549.1 hypothetical protein [Rhodocytophaga aerolata]
MENTERLQIIQAIDHYCQQSMEELAAMPITELQLLYNRLLNDRLRTCVFCHTRFAEHELKCPKCKSTYLY